MTKAAAKQMLSHVNKIEDKIKEALNKQRSLFARFSKADMENIDEIRNEANILNNELEELNFSLGLIENMVTT